MIVTERRQQEAGVHHVRCVNTHTQRNKCLHFPNRVKLLLRLPRPALTRPPPPSPAPPPGHVRAAPLVLISALKSLSSSRDRLSSPSVFLTARDLHSNGWTVSTGEADEDQSRELVLLRPLCTAVLHLQAPSSQCSLCLQQEHGG